MGDKGAVYACADGESGIVPAKKVNVIDTTGAGDAFFAGTVIGRAYGKTMVEACGIGSRLAASVICTAENVCPRFRPQEFGWCAGHRLIFAFLARFPLFCLSDFAHFAFLAVFYPHVFGLYGIFSAFQYRNFAHSFLKIQNI